MDICCLNAQTLRGSTDKGETAWNPLNPTLGVARPLTAVEINSHVTAERSEVARISFLVLNYYPLFLGSFSDNNTFSGDLVKNHLRNTTWRAASRARSCPGPWPAPATCPARTTSTSGAQHSRPPAPILSLLPMVPGGHRSLSSPGLRAEGPAGSSHKGAEPAPGGGDRPGSRMPLPRRHSPARGPWLRQGEVPIPGDLANYTAHLNFLYFQSVLH